MNFTIGQRVRVLAPPIAMNGRYVGATGVVVDVSLDVCVRLERGTYLANPPQDEEYVSEPGAWFDVGDVRLLMPNDNEVDA